MGVALDIAGKKFGRLTAIRRVYRVGRTGRRRCAWVFRCDCGRRVITEPHEARTGGVVSCGCWKREVTRARHRASREAKAAATA
jgi:hypothetical protein